jgi:hypothetical protein
MVSIPIEFHCPIQQKSSCNGSLYLVAACGWAVLLKQEVLHILVMKLILQTHSEPIPEAIQAHNHIPEGCLTGP